MIVRLVFDYTYHHHTLNKIRKPSLEMTLIFNWYKVIDILVIILDKLLNCKVDVSAMV